MIGNKEKLLDKPNRVIAANISNNEIDNINRDNTQGDNDNNYIFYDSERIYSEQLVFNATLNQNNNYKVLVFSDKKASFDFLCVKIAECFEKFENFSNLEGLKAINLYKKNDKGEIIKFPQIGNIGAYISKGDNIFCDLSSEDYWIKARINIYIEKKHYNSFSFDFKSRTDITIKKMNSSIIKFVINYFLDQRHKIKDKYHYIMEKILFKFSKSDIIYNYKSDLSQSILLNKISEYFDYTSQITYTFHFSSLETILIKQLQSVTKCYKYLMQTRLLQFREFENVEMLKESKIFTREYKYVMKFINYIFDHSIYKRENVSELFYIYNSYNSLQNFIDRNELSKKKLLVIIPKTYEYVSYYNDDNSNARSMSKLSLSKSPIFEKKIKRSSSFLETSKNSVEFLFERDKEIQIQVNNVIKQNDKEIEKNTKIQSQGNEIFESENYGVDSISSSLHIQNLRNTSRYDNLCKEFKKSLKEKKYLENIDSSYNLKLEVNSIEKALIPQFRKYQIIKEENSMTLETIPSLKGVQVNEPALIKLIKEICTFILTLGIIIVIIIIVLFCTL